MIKIAFIALEHSFGSSITGPLDVFNTANKILSLKDKLEPIFDCKIVSENGKPVTSFNGYPQPVDCSWNELGQVDMVIVPGIFLEGADLLIDTVESNQVLIQWLKEQADNGAQIAGNCSGNFLLAEAGLLDGITATTSWWVSDLFRRRYPKVDLQPDAILTASKQFICSGSAMSCMDMGIYMVERLAGRELAKQCARYLLIDVNRHNQAAYRLPKPQSSNDPVIAKASHYIRKHIKSEISVQGLASELNVSVRTLSRKFTQETGEPPLAYIQKLRIDVGKNLLENSSLALESIVVEVGYQDVSSFRRLFKRETGLSPRDYRKQFTVNTVS